MNTSTNSLPQIISSQKAALFELGTNQNETIGKAYTSTEILGCW